MNTRYHRQQQVPKLGVRSQPLLQNAKVLIVGAGGLGAPVSTLLTGAGVGQISLIDHDIASLSNLHRQTLFTEADVGQPKVFAAQRRLQACNSDVQVDAIYQALTVHNADSLVREHTVVVDAADSFFVSYLLSDLCMVNRIPLVSASVLQTNGYVGVFCGSQNNKAPSMRAIFPSPPQGAQSCNTVGVTGPSVGVLGSIQAQEVIKAIVGDPSLLLGKLLYLDLWDYRQNIVDFTGAPEPELAAELIAETDILWADQVIDVRSVEEVREQPRRGGFINIPVSSIAEQHNELDSSKRLVCVCKSGQRALNAAHQLIDLGYRNVVVAN
ncbi:hypothetical protein NBRC116583_22970 [Arenicella sp. 4NH20-0111]|uniref:HesA/MoeB/ThiF family protein n=1 Tax=Arenicella sp. 4NH20-0111 TaxID=3127648 RepID=UPI0031071802